ncbi:iron ABC transporter permease [Paenibacillus sp. GSMTC-2017]|uniref:FecCD family ABC transporter permease n=1 Tax=Paenibacillus sp. GSMTC-2017 TaxID=2794350 RepID=UPI0018DA2A89|nr:iron ABC transporter permease [Paenibacillus sp. GSMTC-2017]MBH5318849.1 iron ABC transporter permease [Paenibacillus sp. GSMTC-2017]
MGFATAEQIEQKRRKRGTIVLIILGVIILIAFLISMNTGHIRLSPMDVIRTLFGGGDEREALVLFEFRLPRIVLSVLIGAGLAVSGCIMQAISRNALADPGILGINAGAGIMVMLFFSFYPSNAAAPLYMLPILAFVGAGATACLIFVLAYKRHEGVSPTRLLLTGIAVAAGISAAMIVLTLKLSPEKYQFVATWLAGSIWGANWKFVLTLLPWILILIPYVMFKSNTANVLNLGDTTAKGLGVHISREQIKMLAAAVALAAACVSVSGGIGFVGLIAPHLARRLTGPKHQILLPVSAMVGALLVLVADTIGRAILQPSGVPTGIVVAVIGAPYFLYLLARSRT